MDLFSKLYKFFRTKDNVKSTSIQSKQVLKSYRLDIDRRIKSASNLGKTKTTIIITNEFSRSHFIKELTKEGYIVEWPSKTLGMDYIDVSWEDLDKVQKITKEQANARTKAVLETKLKLEQEQLQRTLKCIFKDIAKKADEGEYSMHYRNPSKTMLANIVEELQRLDYNVEYPDGPIFDANHHCMISWRQ